MKKIRSYLVTFSFLTLVVGFWACSNEQDNSSFTEADSGKRVLIDNGPLLGDNLKYQLSGAKWSKNNLTYYFVNQSTKLNNTEARQAVRNAFATWSTASVLTFTEVSSASSADIKVGWYTGSHGDTSSFDGAGNTLAHAYYPPPLGGTYAGVVHFDDDENWGTDGSYLKFDLQSVALHEIGHALGIAHEGTIFSSVMYPSIGSGEIKRTLTMDDILAIRNLYGGYNALTITANNDIACVNENVVYTLSGNIPSDATISWQGTQNATLISGQGTKNATFKVSGYAYAKVQAVITKGNSTTIENAGVWIGPPRFIDSPNYQSTIKRDLLESFFLTAIFNGSPGSYNWKVNGEPLSSKYLDAGDGTISILLKYLRVGDYTYTVDVDNRCGTASELFFVTITN